ncbi:hypothetical protein CD30_17425 [Ureibacillus massiliensis 4400831 = CIP 108448 = CCUG 49529]|uniref:TniQ domain-containing protein n=1 Tax=Ureibacillus massiliensis 4400831 = CIP 108448 = CCUG 49529 TaxID=1211035 RepID=A0A0A3IX83_9BACL|nr:TniQ family protein [Ureibacillus massiliensis]KGR89286.1 hypothetical protein CD30_17425 [Ureibacillus massiliensis 4400831 = CIP 108448 = CCUG 49529]
MEVRRGFTIRAKLIEGESLSSYLIRTANQNAITRISEIWQFVRKQATYKVDRNSFYKFDLFPSDIVQLNELSILLNIRANKLGLHSFEPFVSLFYPGAAGKMIFGKEVEIKNRRFCRSCLNENGAFQLLWQVKEIHMCHKHFTRIESKCHKCGCDQPYLKKDITEHLKCNDCGELLFEVIEEPIVDIDVKTQQLRIHRDWNSLLTIVNYINGNYLNNPQLIHRNIALLLLFLTTPENTRLSSKKHPFFTPSQAFKVLKVVRNKSNEILSLGFILNTLREINIEVSDLLYLKVPMSFMKKVFIKKTKAKKIIIECKSSWCSFFGTVNKMVDMKNSSKGKFVPKTYLYSAVCVCKNCWIQFGLNKELSKWEIINISKNLLSEINDYIEIGFSEKQIIQQLRIYPNKVYYYMGYIYRYNPFCNKNLILEDRITEVNSSILIDNFSLLKPFWRKSYLLAIQASILFGWDVLSTFYYYWHPEVQQYIYLEENSRLTNRKKREELKNNMNEVIKKLVNSNIEISINEIAASLDITEKTLRYHSLHKNINKVKMENKLNKKAEEEALIFEKIDNFIKSKKNSEEQIFVHEVYKFIGISEKIIIKNYPEIAKFISDLAKKSKSEQMLIRRKNLEKAIVHVYRQYGRVDYPLLSEYLGVTEKTLTSSQGVYKGIASLIKSIIADLR